LSFKKGQRLKIVERYSDGWWNAQLVGTDLFGLIPSNYVVQEDRPPATRPQLHTSAFRPEHVRAKFDFDAKDESELSFKKGQKLVIFNRPSDAWWYAQMVETDLTGLIPSTYVEPWERLFDF
jgi:hypothetical protein